MKTIMTPEEYQLFLEVATKQNLSKAAAKLYISQSALSRRISQLERDLDIVLFERTAQGVQLTPGGKLILNKYNGITESYQNMLKKARLFNTGYKGMLRIGIQDGHEFDEISYDFVKIFNENNAGLEVEICCLSHDRLLEKISSAHLDIGFIANFNSIDLENFDHIVTSKSMGHILLSSMHHQANSSNLSNYDFLNHETLLVTDTTVARSGVRFVHEICRGCGFFPAETQLAPSYSTMILRVIMNMGFAVTGKNLWFDHKKLRSFPLPEYAQCDNVAIWTSSNTNPALKRFVNEFKQQILL